MNRDALLSQESSRGCSRGSPGRVERRGQALHVRLLMSATPVCLRHHCQWQACASTHKGSTERVAVYWMVLVMRWQPQISMALRQDENAPRVTTCLLQARQTRPAGGEGRASLPRQHLPTRKPEHAWRVSLTSGLAFQPMRRETHWSAALVLDTEPDVRTNLNAHLRYDAGFAVPVLMS